MRSRRRTASEILDSIAECTADDPDLQALYRVILDGQTKREDIAAGARLDAPTASRPRASSFNGASCAIHPNDFPRAREATEDCHEQ